MVMDWVVHFGVVPRLYRILIKCGDFSLMGATPNHVKILQAETPPGWVTLPSSLSLTKTLGEYIFTRVPP